MEIKGRFDHFNFNVLDLEKSIRFYEKALGLKRSTEENRLRRFLLSSSIWETGKRLSPLELTWLR